MVLCCNANTDNNFPQTVQLVDGYAFISGMEDLKFKPRADQIGHSVINGSPSLRHFFVKSCVFRAQLRGDWLRKLVTRFGVVQPVK